MACMWFTRAAITNTQTGCVKKIYFLMILEARVQDQGIGKVGIF